MNLSSLRAWCESARLAIAQIHVKAPASAHTDETGYGKCGENRMWLWIAVTQTMELFVLQPGRGGD